MSHRFFGRCTTLFRLLGIALILTACTAAPAPPNTLPAIETSVATSLPEEADCSSQHSIDGSVETAITFVNSRDDAITVNWIDYQGKEQFWFELQPGQSHRQETFVSHPWCVRDNTSNAILLSVVAGRVEQLATIALPASTVSIVLTPSPIPPDVNNATPDPRLGMIQWAETNRIPIPSAAPFDSLRGQQLIFHNGYVYVFGGRGVIDDRLTNVYFSAIRLDGTLVGWVETTPLPARYYDHVVVKVGNYIYLLAGAASVDDVYYAPFNPDNSIGAWQKTSSLSPSRQTFAAAGHGTFIYVTGGNFGGTQSFVQYASVKPDGSLNSWAYTTSLPVAIQEHTMIAYNGYLYVIGGRKADDQWVNTVYFSAIQPDGTLADWETTTSLPRKVSGIATFESNGNIYVLGNNINNVAFYTRILGDHTLENWRGAGSLPSIGHGLRVGANNGFAYALGGNDNASFQDTVYYGGLGLQLSAETPVINRPDCTSGWTRLEAGQEAKISDNNSLTNRVRLGPGTNEPIVALLYPGTIVRLIEGPVCADGAFFWKVGSYPTGIGWTAEGDGRDYFLDPIR